RLAAHPREVHGAVLTDSQVTELVHVGEQLHRIYGYCRPGDTAVGRVTNRNLRVVAVAELSSRNVNGILPRTRGVGVDFHPGFVRQESKQVGDGLHGAAPGDTI